MRNRFLQVALTASFCASGFAAGGSSGFHFISADEAERYTFAGQVSNAAMWIFADRAVYQPGQSLTLRWTVKPNNDLFPYTIVAYRQNNQTGAKSYLPGGTATATDIFGNTIEQGFRILTLPAASKQVLVGAGGIISSSPATIPNEAGMHTLVVQLRDYTGTRVVKSAYWKIGVVTAFEDLPSEITANRTLTNDKAYNIRGIVAVRNNATLTIQPGTFLIGQPGSQPPSVLLVGTNGRLVAEGTRSRPIIMTSSQPVGSRLRGDWGGLVLLGLAPLNDPGGSLTIEGLPELPETRYGGTDAAHNCGSLRYVRVEFAGALLRPNEETNGITWGGCGTATRSEYLQSHYGLDDAFEWFGGLNDLKYAVATYAADDFFDGQIGWRGRVQYGVGVANPDRSNRGIEMDNYERDFAARPLSKPTFYNMTFVGSGAPGFDESDAPCLYFRRGAGAVVNNTLCVNWTTRGFGGANLDSIEPLIASGDFNANGIILWDNGRDTTPPAANTMEGQVLAGFQAFANAPARQFLIADPMLGRPLEYSDPDLRPKPGSPALRPNWVQPPDDGFFDQHANFAGAFGDVDWTEEWTIFVQEQDLKP
jgi:hypothetical protein